MCKTIYLLKEATEHYAWFQHEVQAGIDSANAGDLIAAEDVEAEAAAWRAEMRLKISRDDS